MLQLATQFAWLLGAMLPVHILSHYHHPASERVEDIKKENLRYKNICKIKIKSRCYCYYVS